jgi:anti-sigma regulatory factor (Ser/Thr protein kinase)
VTDTRRFRCEPAAVPAVRRFVRDALREQSRELVDAAELMACELATNCVRHARTDFELAIRSDCQIRIEVRDTGQGEPRPRSPTPREPSGRGLRIVEAMSSTWGVIPSPSGKTVWFTLPQQPRASNEPSRSAAAGDRPPAARDGRHSAGEPGTGYGVALIGFFGHHALRGTSRQGFGIVGCGASGCSTTFVGLG